MQEFRNKDYESQRTPIIITNDGDSALHITQKDKRLSSFTLEIVQATAIPMCAICWMVDVYDGIPTLRVF